MNGSTAEFEDLSAYSRSLRKLLEAFEKSNETSNWVKPSLVTAKEGDDKNEQMLSFARRRDYRRRAVNSGVFETSNLREKQFLRELTKFGQRGASVWELTRKVYGDIVGVVVLLMSCLKITKQHLEKMSKDGTVMVRRKESENPIMTILTYLMAYIARFLWSVGNNEVRGCH